MIVCLIDLTVRGTCATLAVLVLDLLLTRRMWPRPRRAWWILVALVWMIPLRLPRLPGHFQLPLPTLAAVPNTPLNLSWSRISPLAVTVSGPWENYLGTFILAGTLAALCATGLRTWRTSRRWNPERLCTDPQLLGLFEDCKAVAGVTAPIGLVLTDSISTPALLGWLRPRILLPRSLLANVPPMQLRGILLHELAHFRSSDIIVNWLFTLATALHWYNPVVYLASWRWRQYCEFAADATALEWMPAASTRDYGEALINAVSHANTMAVPRGALALGESFENLKERITLVAAGSGRARLAWLAVCVASALVAFIAVPSRAWVDSAQIARQAVLPGLRATTPFNLAGHWEGAIALPAASLTVTIDFMRGSDGAWLGAIDVPGQGHHGFWLKPININGEAVDFGIPGIPGDPYFNGVMSGDGNAMEGNYTQGGQKLTFNLRRTTPDASPTKGVAGAGFEGSWQGTLKPSSGVELRMALDIDRAGPGGPIGVMTSMDQGNGRFAITAVAERAAGIHFETPTFGGTFDGKMNADGSEVSGDWKQGSLAIPVTFRRLPSTK